MLIESWLFNFPSATPTHVRSTKPYGVFNPVLIDSWQSPVLLIQSLVSGLIFLWPNDTSVEVSNAITTGRRLLTLILAHVASRHLGSRVTETLQGEAQSDIKVPEFQCGEGAGGHHRPYGASVWFDILWHCLWSVKLVLLDSRMELRRCCWNADSGVTPYLTGTRWSNMEDSMWVRGWQGAKDV